MHLEGHGTCPVHLPVDQLRHTLDAQGLPAAPTEGLGRDLRVARNQEPGQADSRVGSGQVRVVQGLQPLQDLGPGLR